MSTPSKAKKAKLEEPKFILSNVPMDILKDTFQFLDRDSIELCEIANRKFKDLVFAYSKTLPLRSIFRIRYRDNYLSYQIKEQVPDQLYYSYPKPLLLELAERLQNVVIQRFNIVGDDGPTNPQNRRPIPFSIEKCVEDLKEIVKISGKLIVKELEYVQFDDDHDWNVIRSLPKIWELMDVKETDLDFNMINLRRILTTPSLIEHPGLPPKVYISCTDYYIWGNEIFEMIEKSKFQSLDRRYTLEIADPKMEFCERYFKLFTKPDGAPKMFKKIVFGEYNTRSGFKNTDVYKETVAFLNGIPDIRIIEGLEHKESYLKGDPLTVYEVEKEDGWIFRVELSCFIVYKVYHKNEGL